MGQTTWLPRTTFEQPRQWLLTNGDVVTEPPLEQTSTGRKVRVAGTDVTAYAKDMNDLILRAVDSLATSKGAKPWMPLANRREAVQGATGFDPDQTRAELHVIDPNRDATRVWWLFKHPTLPIEALVWVEAAEIYRNTGVATRVVMPFTTPDNSALAAQMATVTSPNFTEAWSHLWGDEFTKAREFMRDNRPAWTEQLSYTTCSNERGVVEELLKRVRAIEELETIEVPDFRDLDNPGYLELELYDTNCNSAFVSDLAEYLEGTPTLERALQLYDELRQCLRGVGLVLDEKTENDFQSALHGKEVTVDIDRISAPNAEGGYDHDHSLTMHLATGTFVVNCGVSVNYGEIANLWDEAKTVASLTGEEDTLLAFAREAARQGHQKRARKTIRERKGETT